MEPQLPYMVSSRCRTSIRCWRCRGVSEAVVGTISFGQVCAALGWTYECGVAYCPKCAELRVLAARLAGTLIGCALRELVPA